MNEEKIWLEYSPIGSPRFPGAPKTNSCRMSNVRLHFTLRFISSNSFFREMLSK